MTSFKSGSRFLLAVPVAAFLVSQGVSPVSAQSLPDATGQEVLIKSSLSTFNDANVTGNYSVFHAKLSKPFRDQFSPEKLKATFKSFNEQNIDFDFIVSKEPIADIPSAIDGDGTLALNGHFDTKPSRITYKLEYIRSDSEWKLVGINVKLGEGNKPAEPAATPAPAPAEKSSSGKVQMK